jgi:hypothetical protein
MKRREFLKGLGLMSLWMISSKGPPQAEAQMPEKESPEKESPENRIFCGGTSVDKYANVYFTDWCSSSYFQVGCHPGRFSFCDTCRENPKNL